MVYLVSDGHYSDYHQLGIYTTRELADQARVFFNADNDVEEWELDVIPKHPHGLLAWTVYMDRNGNLPSGNVYVGNGVRRDSVDGFEPTWIPCSKNGTVVCFRVWAKDEDHAVKIANEQRIGLLASGEWTSDWEVWFAKRWPKK